MQVGNLEFMQCFCCFNIVLGPNPIVQMGGSLLMLFIGFGCIGAVGTKLPNIETMIVYGICTAVLLYYFIRLSVSSPGIPL